MNLLRLLPVILSCLLLSAHFLRWGNTLMVLVCLAFPFLLFLRRAWVPTLMQLAMFLGSLVWIWSLVGLASSRQAGGVPATRLIAIMAGVALFTGLSAFVFMLPALRRRYRARS